MSQNRDMGHPLSVPGSYPGELDHAEMVIRQTFVLCGTLVRRMLGPIKKRILRRKGV